MKPNSTRVASRSPRRGSRSNVLRNVTAAKPRFSSWTREWSLMVTCSESARCGGMSSGVCKPARCHGRSWWWKTTRPVVLGQHGGGQVGRIRIDRERAEVLDDDEVGAGDRRRERAGIGRAAVDRIDGEERQPGVVGPETVVELAGDPSYVEAELVQRPFPLARLDRDAVGAAESIRHLDATGGIAPRRLAGSSRVVRISSMLAPVLQAGQAAVGRVEQRACDGVVAIAADDGRSGHRPARVGGST